MDLEEAKTYARLHQPKIAEAEGTDAHTELEAPSRREPVMPRAKL